MKEEEMERSSAGHLLLEATFVATSEDLQWMVLDRNQLPQEVSGFEPLQERELDNATMAEHSLGGRTKGDLRELGRITGYSRQFAVPQGGATLAEEPAEILEAATVVHLFERPEDVRRWIDEVFVRDFPQLVGKEAPNGQRVVGVERVETVGFHGYSAGLMVVHEVPGGVLSSTIVDFQVGRLLGVVYVVAKRDKAFKELAQDIALRLERQMVRVILGS